ncbi:DMT family transporter [Sulfuritortus calidifontis]|nr:DMT family transporter [Sulfuritortus calidifontis]
MRKQNLLPPLGLLTAATVWGIVWYPYRLLEEAGISGSLASLITYLIALVPVLLLCGRDFLRQREQRGWLVLVALATGWTNLAYVLAVIHGEVMRVLLLFYLAPLWTVFFARLILGERVNQFGYLVMGLSLAGAYVMLARNGGLPLPTNFAEWMGLSAGVAFALANVLSRKMREVATGVRSLWVFLGVVGIAAFPVGFEGGALTAVAGLDSAHWLILIGVGLLLVLATFAVQYGLAHTPASQAIVILLSELVIAAIASRLLAHEVMDAREWLGGALIVAASLFSGRIHQETKT